MRFDNLSPLSCSLYRCLRNWGLLKTRVHLVRRVYPVRFSSLFIREWFGEFRGKRFGDWANEVVGTSAIPLTGRPSWKLIAFREITSGFVDEPEVIALANACVS